MSAVLICGSVGLRPDVIGGFGFASTIVLFGVGQPARIAEWFSVMLGVGAKSCAGKRFESHTVGVGQDAIFAAPSSVSRPRAVWSGWSFTLHVGVGQPVSTATSLSGRAFVPHRSTVAPFQSRVVGVGHEVEALADVRSADPRSAEIDSRDGVTLAFQVRVNKVEPRKSVFARNLFTKDVLRLALRDEMVPGRPKMPLIIKPIAFACRAERLARTTSGPDGLVVGPSSTTERQRPNADAGEEVALGVLLEFIGRDVLDRPLINHTGGDQTPADQFSQDGGSAIVNLVVEVHSSSSSMLPNTWLRSAKPRTSTESPAFTAKRTPRRLIASCCTSS